MDYVILGSSAAGVNAARELAMLDKTGTITMISKDEAIYSRCILHHFLGNVRTLEQLNFAEKDFAGKFGINWIKGEEVIHLDVEQKQVTTDKGTTVSYDKLLIATGSHSFMPPIEGLSSATNAVGFRNIEDIIAIKEAVPLKKHIVIMGAGLVGMDCACGLIDLGYKPSIVEMGSHLLNKQLDHRSATTYINAFNSRGVTQYYSLGMKELIMEGTEITGLLLTNGTTIPCDYLIVTIGVRANVKFLEGSSVETDRFGLTFDESGQTSVADIYGAGDVSGKAPIWPVAVKEGIIAAHNMTGGHRKMSDFFASKSTMNFLEIPTMSLGIAEPTDDTFIVERLDRDGNYKKIIHKNGKIYGAILQGDLSYSGILQQLIMHKIDVRRVKKSIFEIDYSDFFRINHNFEFYFEEDNH